MGSGGMSVIQEAVHEHLSTPERLTMAELEDFRGLAAVVAEYGFLYQDDMTLLKEMVQRHERLGDLLPYAISPDAEDRVFGKMKLALMKAAIEIAEVE